MAERDFSAGDRAVEELAGRLKAISGSDASAPERFGLIAESLRAAGAPWNLRGDDRVLGKMRIEAGTAVEAVVDSEMARILARFSKEDALDELTRLKEAVARLMWVAEGFRSSMNAKLAMATAEIRRDKPA